MGKLNGLILFYCTLLSLVILVSGIVSGKGDNLIFQLLFLPVPLYLIYQLVAGIFSLGKAKEDFSLSKKAFFFQQLLGITFFSIILLVLSFISLVNINKPPLQIKATPVETSEKVLLVTSPEASAAAIYFEATTSAKVIQQVKNNDRLVVVNQKPGWYQVLLPENLTGWILEEFVRLPKTK